MGKQMLSILVLSQPPPGWAVSMAEWGMGGPCLQWVWGGWSRAVPSTRRPAGEPGSSA